LNFERPQASNLHIYFFGCLPYAHILNEKCPKLDTKAIKCLFLDYGNLQGVKDYHLYNLKVNNFLKGGNFIFKKTSYFKTSFHLTIGF
jgi:hypothetical protein